MGNTSYDTTRRSVNKRSITAERFSFSTLLFISVKYLSKEVKQMRRERQKRPKEGFRMRKVQALSISRRRNQYCKELHNIILCPLYVKRKVIGMDMDKT